MVPGLRTLAPRPLGSTPAVAEKPGCKEHSEEEWQANKALIEKLYIGDNRKLSETIAILKSKHGFAAT